MQKPTLIDLPALYPACFDWNRPRPLKIGILEDLLAAGHEGEAARLALKKYCLSARYLRAHIAGTPRIDLQGEPAGIVTDEHAKTASVRLAGQKEMREAARWKRLAQTLPADAPIPPENTVSGRLELTVKFSQRPKPVPVKTGMKIGIQTETALVVATLPPKAWKKLEQAVRDWPQWVASLTGKLGAQAGADAGSVVVLEQPALQVFQKKAKPKPAGG